MGLFHHRQTERSNCGGDQGAAACGTGSLDDSRQQLVDLRSRGINSSVIIPSENSWTNDSYKATIAKNFQFTDQNYNQALNTAASEGKPIVAVFGSRSLRDSQQLVENAIPASGRQKDAVYVYIDTDRAKSNPNFSNLINTEIKPTNLAHTRVYSLSCDNSGKLIADRPLMTAWGGRGEIGGLVRDHVAFGLNNMHGKNLAPDVVQGNAAYPKRLPDSPPAPDLPPLILTDTPTPLPVPPPALLARQLEPPPVPVPPPVLSDRSNLYTDRRSAIPALTEVPPPPEPAPAVPRAADIRHPPQYGDRSWNDESHRRPEAGRVVDLNPRDFERLVKNSDKPVILDVSATWCGPCRNLAPILDGVAKRYSGQATVYKLDLDRLTRENPRLAQELNVSSVPAVFTYEHGKQVGRPMIGLESTAAYHQRAQSLVERHAQSEKPQNEKKESQRDRFRPNTDKADDHGQPTTRFERRIEKLKHKLEKLTHLSHEEKEMAFRPNEKEQRVFQLINNERRKAGLPGVLHDPRLQIIANRHNNYQAANNVMTHNENTRGWQNVSQRMKQVGLEGWRENAATGQFTPEVLVRMWMDSPPHRAAILGQGNIAAVAVRNGKATFNLTQDPELERY